MDLHNGLTPAEMAEMEDMVSEAELGLLMGGPVQDYIEARGLSTETASGFRLGEHKGQLLIPYLDTHGVKPINWVLRLLNGKPKYYGKPGGHRAMFNVRALREGDIVHVCEGEIDTMSLAQCGVAAVGIPGATNIGPIQRALLTSANGLIVWTDPDDAGRGMLEAIQKLGLRKPVFNADQDMDVNDLLVNEGEEALRETALRLQERMRDMIDAA